jgi:hypothetical protein
MDIYLTNEILFPRPATPTLSPHRERRTAALFSSALASFLCWSGDVEACRPLNLARMLAFVPQNCRAAMDGTPEPLVLLSATIAVRGTCKVSAVAREDCDARAVS